MTDTAAWDTAVEIGRWTNVVLGTAGLVLLFTTVRAWRHRSAGNRFLWMGIGVFLVNSIFGTAEQLVAKVDGGWRVAVTTVAAVYVVAALILKRRGRWLPQEYTHAPPERAGS